MRHDLNPFSASEKARSISRLLDQSSKAFEVFEATQTNESYEAWRQVRREIERVQGASS